MTDWDDRVTDVHEAVTAASIEVEKNKVASRRIEKEGFYLVGMLEDFEVSQETTGCVS